MTVSDQKNYPFINFLQIFDIKILVCIRIRIGSGLDPDLATGSGFSESGSETLLQYFMLT
jgi:hypothetical protein